ncbi:MAG TPA: hypothetical protein DCY00_02185 [Actinobacteria bacterium]|jgi:predicted DNA-binding protein|nr:hypothetical protein [Actinomycetota bacterium]
MKSKFKNFTFSLSEETVSELKNLASDKKGVSLNYVVREALTQYISGVKKNKYEEELKLAAKDPDFIKDYEEVARDFSSSDKETSDMMEKW